MKLSDGRAVRDAQAWLKRRRPELLRLFEDNQFGRSPGRPADMRFAVFERAARRSAARRRAGRSRQP